MAETKRSAVAATRQRRVKRARLKRACAPQAHSSLVTRSSPCFKRKIEIIGYAPQPFVWYH